MITPLLIVWVVVVVLAWGAVVAVRFRRRCMQGWYLPMVALLFVCSAGVDPDGAHSLLLAPGASCTLTFICPRAIDRLIADRQLPPRGTPGPTWHTRGDGG